MSTFTYGVWITEDGPGKGALVKIEEQKFIAALKEAIAISPGGDVERAVDIIKAQVMAELRRVLAKR
jgi:hypothetical protein